MLYQEGSIISFKFLKQVFGLVIGVCALNSNGICSTNSSNIMSNAFMQDSQSNSNYNEENIINNINLINDEVIIELYTTVKDVYFVDHNVNIRYANVPRKYNIFADELIALADISNKFWKNYCSDDSTINDLINHSISYVTQLDSNLKQITDSFLKETKNIAISFSEKIRLLKEKLSTKLVTKEEIANCIKLYEKDSTKLFKKRVDLLKNLKSDINNYIDNKLNNCSSKIKQCLKNKINNNIEQIITFFQ